MQFATFFLNKNVLFVMYRVLNTFTMNVKLIIFLKRAIGYCRPSFFNMFKDSKSLNKNKMVGNLQLILKISLRFVIKRNLPPKN